MNVLTMGWNQTTTWGSLGAELKSWLYSDRWLREVEYDGRYIKSLIAYLLCPANSPRLSVY